jgi:MraZ protein
VFRGVNSLAIDDKGRMAIPARYREDLLEESAPHLIITIDTESTCLLLYPYSQWELIEKKIEALPSFNPAARRIQRLLIGHATETALDNNGRILLPQALRDYAKLTKNVVLIGQGKKFELWDEQHWLDCRQGWLEEATQVGELPPDLLSLSL